MLLIPWPDQKGYKLQRPNSNFRKPLKKKNQKVVRLTSSSSNDLRVGRATQKTLKKNQKVVHLTSSSSNDLRVGRKMATFQLFFQSGRAKDLSAPLYLPVYMASHFSRFESLILCMLECYFIDLILSNTTLIPLYRRLLQAITLFFAA